MGSITKASGAARARRTEIGGPAYEDSVNVCRTDLVAALRWIRENIANFGGDPDAIMIYGQSGGKPAFPWRKLMHGFETERNEARP